MQNQITFKGWRKSYRLKLKRTREYSDKEFRLIEILLHIVDWDRKHANFAVTKESLRDIQRHYLPAWSVGKIQAAMQDLISRGVIERNSDGHIVIPNYRAYSDVQSDEQGVQPNEQPVHPDIQGVQPAEQSDTRQIDEQIPKPLLNTAQVSAPVQQGEQADAAKETLKTLTQHQTGDDGMLIIDKLVERYGNDIRVPLKKYAPVQVRDAARRMEARARYKNERIGNPIGYITTLCKEGILWEDSEERRLEDGIKAREAEERRKMEEVSKPISAEQRERNRQILDKMGKELAEKLGWKR